MHKINALYHYYSLLNLTHEIYWRFHAHAIKHVVEFYPPWYGFHVQGPQITDPARKCLPSRPAIHTIHISPTPKLDIQSPPLTTETHMRKVRTRCNHPLAISTTLPHTIANHHEHPPTKMTAANHPFHHPDQKNTTLTPQGLLYCLLLLICMCASPWYSPSHIRPPLAIATGHAPLKQQQDSFLSIVLRAILSKHPISANQILRRHRNSFNIVLQAEKLYPYRA